MAQENNVVKIDDEELAKIAGGDDASVWKWRYRVNTHGVYCANIRNGNGKAVDRAFTGDILESSHHIKDGFDYQGSTCIACKLRHVRKNINSPWGWVNNDYLEYVSGGMYPAD